MRETRNEATRSDDERSEGRLTAREAPAADTRARVVRERCVRSRDGERRERCASDLSRCDTEQRQQRPMASEAHAEKKTRETRNASYAVVVTSEAKTGRRRGSRAPTTREREIRASDRGRHRADERRKRGSTAPKAHAEMETRETQNASNVIVAMSNARESWPRGRRAPTTR